MPKDVAAEQHLNAKFGTLLAEVRYLSSDWSGDDRCAVSGTVKVYNNGVLFSAEPITGTYRFGVIVMGADKQ